jgi:hypothetical protein
MTQHDNTEKDDRQDRYQRRRGRAHEDTRDHTPRRRRTPYKREQVDYDHYLQEELEDEDFE